MRVLPAGTRLEGIGGHDLYGILEKPGNLPIGMAERAILLIEKKRDDPITWDDVKLPDDDPRIDLWKDQSFID